MSISAQFLPQKISAHFQFYLLNFWTIMKIYSYIHLFLFLPIGLWPCYLHTNSTYVTYFKATRHFICKSCSNWVDFVKSGCEKSWVEAQADSFSFECRGYTRMKELEMELEQLRLLVVAVIGREQVGCASGSGGGTVDDKVGEDDEIDASESSPQPGRKLRGDKVTGRKETRRKEIGGKTNGSKERGVGETVAKESGGAKR